MVVTEAIAAVSAHNNLTEEDACSVMTEIMSGLATDAQIAGLITALCMKGETEGEIAGFARALRSGAAEVNISGSGLVDTCGTGGDMALTFNISTVAAFVVAACGVPVAKHGNRSVSSKCGSADVLEALGVKLELSPAAAVGAVEKTGIGFLFAPVFHAAMKHAVRARKEIGIRTVFNLLGPLGNPAGAEYQLMGVYKPGLTETLGRVLKKLGVNAALVVHGEGGLDEISTLGKTRITEVNNRNVTTYEITPEMFGLKRASIADLRGGESRINAEIALNILEGKVGPKQDIVVLNAAAALYIAGKVNSIKEGINKAREAINSGDALHKFKHFRQYTIEAVGEEVGAENLFSSA